MVYFEYVRKLMGWCPNASGMDNGINKVFEKSTLILSGSGSRLTSMISDWWSKYRNKRLLISVLFTLQATGWLFEKRMNNMDFFLAGLFAGILSGVLSWRPELRSLDKLISSGTVKYSKKELFSGLSILILALVLLFLSSKYFFDPEKTWAFVYGLFIFFWINYFELVYWEKKNGKRLVVRKHRIIGLSNSGD